jgi:hypothetical protein
VTRDDAAEKLKAFIANYAKAADNVDGMINAIEDSIRRFAKGRSNPEVRDQAKMLAEKAKLYRKANTYLTWRATVFCGTGFNSAYLRTSRQTRFGASINERRAKASLVRH